MYHVSTYFFQVLHSSMTQQEREPRTANVTAFSFCTCHRHFIHFTTLRFRVEFKHDQIVSSSVHRYPRKPRHSVKSITYRLQTEEWRRRRGGETTVQGSKFVKLDETGSDRTSPVIEEAPHSTVSSLIILATVRSVYVSGKAALR